MGVNVNWNCSFQSPSGYSGNPSMRACHSGPCQSTMPDNPYDSPTEQQYSGWGTQTVSDGSTYCVEPALPGTTIPGWDRQGGKFQRGKKVRTKRSKRPGLRTAPSGPVQTTSHAGPCTAADLESGMANYTCTGPNDDGSPDIEPCEGLSPGSLACIHFASVDEITVTGRQGGRLQRGDRAKRPYPKRPIGFPHTSSSFEYGRGGEVSGVQRFSSGGRVGRSRLGHPIKKR